MERADRGETVERAVVHSSGAAEIMPSGQTHDKGAAMESPRSNMRHRSCALSALVFTLLTTVVLVSPLEGACPALTITSPAAGAEFHRGDTVIVTVEGGTGFEKVGVVEGPVLDPGEILTAPPYRFELHVPLDAEIGPTDLIAGGFTPGGEGCHSNYVTIAIERPDSPTKLVTDLRTLGFEEIGAELGITIDGIFKDGSKIDLTRSTWTRFTSSNPSVVTVTAGILVKAIGAGRATITITNRAARLIIPVSVWDKKAPG